MTTRSISRLLGTAFIIAVSSLAVGCDDGIQTGDEQNHTEFLLDGVPATEFYDEFVYERVEPLEHYYPSTWDNVPLPGSGRAAALSLYMRDDHSFVAEYEELAPRNAGGSAVEFEKEITGTWHVFEDQLVLEGLGVAEGSGHISDRGSLRLELTFERDIETAGLKDQTATLRIVRSTWGPDGNEE